MKTKRKQRSFYSIVVWIFGIMLMISSCVPQHKLKYVQDDGSHYRKSNLLVKPGPRQIKPFDNLYIKVLSIDEKTAKIFSNESSFMRTIDVNLMSYSVDNKGYIDFPFIGEIFVNGLTIVEAKKKIQNELSQYLSNTAITVKFLNNRITVLGEVRTPGDLTFYEDQITIFQALGLAGGMTEFADKEGVILIREVDEVARFIYLDLTDKHIVESQYLYLNPDDVLIVDPIKAKFRRLRSVSYSEILSTISTLITVLIFLQVS